MEETDAVPIASEEPESICKNCGQERWLDVNGDTTFFWCPCGSPIEEVREEKRHENTTPDPDYFNELGIPL
jgi:hypothetical protein